MTAIKTTTQERIHVLPATTRRIIHNANSLTVGSQEIIVLTHVTQHTSRRGKRGEGSEIGVMVLRFCLLPQGLSLQRPTLIKDKIGRFFQLIHTFNSHPDETIHKGSIKPSEEHIHILGKNKGVNIGIIPQQ
jgi:hypothetical protein